MNIKRYTVGELRMLIDLMIYRKEIDDNSPVLIDDYEGNCPSGGCSHLGVYSDDGRLYLCCDFHGEQPTVVFERTPEEIANMSEEQRNSLIDPDLTNIPYIE